MHSPVNRAGAAGAAGQNSAINNKAVGKTPKGRKVSTVSQAGNPKDSAALRKSNPNKQNSKSIDSRKTTPLANNDGETRPTIKTSHKTISSSVRGLKEGIGLDTNIESFQLARRDVAIGTMRSIRELTSRVQGGNAKLKEMGFEKGSPADEALNRVVNTNSPNTNDIEQVVRTMAEHNDAVVDTLNYLVYEGNGKKGLVASEELKPLLEESATPGKKNIESLITDCVDSFKDSGFSEALESRVTANEKGVQEQGSKLDSLEATQNTLVKALDDAASTIGAVGLTAKNNEQAIKELETKTSQNLEALESRQQNTLDEKLAQIKGDTEQKLDEASKTVDKKLAETSEEINQKLAEAEQRQTEQVSDLENQMGQLSNDNMETRQKAEDNSKAIETLQTELGTIQALNGDISGILDRFTTTDEQVEKANATAEDAHNLAKEAMSLANDTAEKAANAEQVANQANTAAEDARDLAKDAMSLASDTAEKVVNAEQVANQANTTAEDARNLAKDAMSLAGDTAEKVVNAEQVANQANTTAEDAKEKVATQEKRLNEQQQEIESLKTAREEQQHAFELRFKAFEEGLAAMNNELTTTKDKLASLEGQLANGINQSGANTNDVDLLRKELLTHVHGLQQNVDLESQRAKTAEQALANKIKNFDEQIHGHEEKIDQIAQEQERLGENQQQLESKSKTLESAAKRLEGTMNSGGILEDERVTKLEGTVERLESALGGVNTEKAHHEDSVMKMVEEIKSLNQEIKELREQIGELKANKPATKPAQSDSHGASAIQSNMKSTTPQGSTASLKALVAKEHRFGLLSEAKISLDMLLSTPPQMPPDEPVVNVVIDGKKLQISPVPKGKTLNAWIKENKEKLTLAKSMIEGEQTVMKSADAPSSEPLPSDTQFKTMLQTKIKKEEEELNTGNEQATWLTEIENFRKKLERQLTIDFKRPSPQL
ncbi:hypothetical protein [Candidatus Sororendozoicomonas aggregata]|uniref:hypothetical protein n=1 Tax=Candidatus Sororendozoicomonas aggregata TaxID=3073239 RepID=UPI002ED4944C